MNLQEIIDKCNYDDLSNVSKDDLQYAVCALNSLLIFETMSIRKLASLEEGKKPFLATCPKWQMEESFRRVLGCMNKHPKEWLGENNDPKNTENVKNKKMARKLFQDFNNGEREK